MSELVQWEDVGFGDIKADKTYLANGSLSFSRQSSDALLAGHGAGGKSSWAGHVEVAGLTRAGCEHAQGVDGDGAWCGHGGCVVV